MKKGTLRLLPLQADLCLNKQKVDIEDFKGWNKNNAPVYGNCLSPLYKKNNTHHDFFIGDNNYDFTSGVLYKNGTAVLSGAGTKKIKKTGIAQDYSALDVASDGTLTWVKEVNATTISYSINGASAVTVSLADALRVVSTKAFVNDTYSVYGIAVLFLRTNGNYGYYLAWGNNTSYGSGSPTQFTGFDVVSPLIQVAVFSANDFMVSFFGSSGANLSKTDVKNVFVKSNVVYDNPSFIDPTNYPTRYTTVEKSTGARVYIETLCSSAGNAGTWGQGGIQQKIEITMLPHDTEVEIDLVSKDPTKNNTVAHYVFPPNSKEVVVSGVLSYWFRNVNGTIDYRSQYSYSLFVDGTLSDNYTLMGDTNTALVPNASDYRKDTALLIVPAFTLKNDPRLLFGRITTKTCSNPNDTSAPTYTSTIQHIFGGRGYNGIEIVNSSSDCHAGNYGSQDLWTFADFEGSLQAYRRPVQGFRSSSGANWVYDYMFYDGLTPPLAWWGEHYAGNLSYMPDATGNGYYNFTPQSATIYTEYYIKTAYTEQSLKDVDCCMDDGNLYCVGALSTDENTPLPTKLLALSGTFVSFDGVTNKVTYTASSQFNITYDYDDETNVFPKYFKGMSISLGNYYLRIVYLFKAKADDTEYINILIDSPSMASGSKAAHLYAGVQSSTNANLQGGVYNTSPSEGFRLLFNNNMVSNISCYEQKMYIGTILADWFTIDDTFCPALGNNIVYYRDIQNRIWKLELVTTGAEWEYKVIENRYVVLNTTNYFNCYDTKTGLKRHWASDYNNRVMYGYEFSEYTNNATFKALLEGDIYSGLLITAQNANYEMTKDTITGLELGAILYSRVIFENFVFYSSDTPYGAVEGIDFYRADEGSTSALYICSYQNSLKYIDNDLKNPDAVYPISQNGDIRYNPNLFTRFISSYNNKDMVISDGVAYKLLYFNNVVPIMAYYLLDGVEELLDAFVLQSSYYGVSQTRLYQMNYSNGVGVEVVCDITNLEYLGALPTQALFWSAQNRAIYSFKGNCIMSLSQYANDLEEIKGKWYNPATQELFLDTNIGLLVFSDLGTYCLPKFTVEIPPAQEGGEPTYEERDIKDIFFYSDMFIINLEDDTDYSYYWSYNPLTGYESNGIHFVTKYYGNARTPITVNNIWIRLYNQDIQNAQGVIQFKGHTVTDSGFQTDEKTVDIGGEEGETWDSETNTMLVKYTPQYNRGLGFALEVHTTFPIIDIKYDYVEDGTIEGQIAHINI